MNAQGNPAEYKPHSNPRICEFKKSVNRRPRCSLHLYYHSKYIGTERKSCSGMEGMQGRYLCNLPLEITFPSAHHSPNTVNKNAKEFVMGTVKLNSVFKFPESNQSVVVFCQNLVQSSNETFLFFCCQSKTHRRRRRKREQQQKNQTKRKERDKERK